MDIELEQSQDKKFCLCIHSSIVSLFESEIPEPGNFGHRFFFGSVEVTVTVKLYRMPFNYSSFRKKTKPLFCFERQTTEVSREKEEKQVFALILISIVTKQKLTKENLCRIQRFCLDSKSLCSDLMMSCNMNTFQQCFNLSRLLQMNTILLSLGLLVGRANSQWHCFIV